MPIGKESYMKGVIVLHYEKRWDSGFLELDPYLRLKVIAATAASISYGS